MSTTFATDDRFETNPTAKPWDPKFTPRISVGFNAALFGFESLLGLGQFLISGRGNLFSGPGILISTLLDLIRVLFVVLVTAYFLMIFWRRFLASISPIRPIDYQEAVAIVLMLAILFRQCEVEASGGRHKMRPWHLKRYPPIAESRDRPVTVTKPGERETAAARCPWPKLKPVDFVWSPIGVKLSDWVCFATRIDSDWLRFVRLVLCHFGSRLSMIRYAHILAGS